MSDFASWDWGSWEAQVTGPRRGEAGVLPVSTPARLGSSGKSKRMGIREDGSLLPKISQQKVSTRVFWVISGMLGLLWLSSWLGRSSVCVLGCGCHGLS